LSEFISFHVSFVPEDQSAATPPIAKTLLPGDFPSHQRAHRLELDRGPAMVQALDQSVPGRIEAQVFGLVHDSRPVPEGHDPDRAAVIMRIRKLPFKFDNRAAGAGGKKIATDGHQVGVEAHDELARRIDPLPRDRSGQAQQDRLVLEQAPEAAGPHLGDELVVPGSPTDLHLRGRAGGLPQLDEALVDRRSQKAGQLLEKRTAQAKDSGFLQIVADPRIGRRPKQRRGSFDHRAEQVLERTGLGLVGHAGTIDGLGRTLQRRFDPDGVRDPRRRGRASLAANGGEFRQHIANRPMVPFQSPGEQRPFAAGTRAAPRGETPSGHIGVALLARHRLEGIRQELVDGRGTNHQALVERFHAVPRPGFEAREELGS
jgi:hypothetical protein